MTMHELTGQALEGQAFEGLTRMDESTPPFDDAAERDVLGCVYLVSIAAQANECHAMAAKLRLSMFYGTRNRDIWSAFSKVLAKGHALTASTVEQIGGLKPALGDLIDGTLVPIGTELVELCAQERFNHLLFDDQVAVLEAMEHRRWLWRKSAELRAMAQAVEAPTVEDTKARLSELLEATERSSPDQIIEPVGVEQLVAYEPDPSTYLVGDNVISSGTFGVCCGWPGLGKSRLTTTLAIAGARGSGQWMGYTIRRRFRTFILQSENSVGRLKSEIMDTPQSLIREWIRWSKPTALAFHRPDFRRRLAQIWEAWPFDLLVIDPWTDVVRDAEAGDVAEAFDNIRLSLPRGDRMPAVLVVAHIRKQGRTDKWRPKAGSELMHEVLGSQGTVGKARTVFALQPGDPTNMEDDTVIFDCGKCNDGRPNPPSAWRRCNGEFQPLPDFDMDAWRNPPDDEVRKVLSEDDVRAVVRPDLFLTRQEAVNGIMARGFSQATAYKALTKFAALIRVCGNGKLTGVA